MNFSFETLLSTPITKPESEGKNQLKYTEDPYVVERRKSSPPPDKSDKAFIARRAKAFDLIFSNPELIEFFLDVINTRDDSWRNILWWHKQYFCNHFDIELTKKLEADMDDKIFDDIAEEFEDRFNIFLNGLSFISPTIKLEVKEPLQSDVNTVYDLYSLVTDCISYTQRKYE